jgi:hypothetical protein
MYYLRAPRDLHAAWSVLPQKPTQQAPDPHPNHIASRLSQPTKPGNSCLATPVVEQAPITGRIASTPPPKCPGLDTRQTQDDTSQCLSKSVKGNHDGGFPNGSHGTAQECDAVDSSQRRSIGDGLE